MYQRKNREAEKKEEERTAKRRNKRGEREKKRACTPQEKKSKIRGDFISGEASGIVVYRSLGLLDGNGDFTRSKCTPQLLNMLFS